MITLAPPSMDLAPSYLEFLDEMRINGEKVWDGIVPSPGETLASFVERLHLEESVPPPDRVPQTTYWAVSEGQVAGRIALRHFLNADLEEFGGHIGYEVRPSFRRKGIAKAMLAKLLSTTKAQEIGQLLLTCAPSNIASNKTILSNGGVLTKTAFVAKWQRDTNYYWIDLSK